jgi:hypothetical protein
LATRVSKNLLDWGYPMGIQGNQAFSHVLTAEAGAIEHSETPIGFSFSSGNSDPRAIDFQKTDVIPISCELTSIAQPEQTVYLHMDFAAGRPLGADKLADHIGTVCFNLLNELDWPAKPTAPSSSIAPRWIPEVRIETVTAPEKATAPGKTITSDSEDRKQIIIHNEGSPLILKFGHERR